MLRVSLALVVASVSLVACGGGSDPSSPTSTGSVVPVPAPIVSTPVPAPTPVVSAPSPTLNVTSLVGANVRITKGLPISAAVCDRSASTIEAVGHVSAIWIKCATLGLPLERVDVGTAVKQIRVEYGNAQVGIVRFETTVDNDKNAFVEIDSVNRIIRFKHTALPLNLKTSVAGTGGALPTQVESIEIEGELKY
jgi:hypothetical protein